MYSGKIVAGLTLVMFGCVALATDRGDHRHAPKVRKAKEVHFTVVTTPVEFLAFLVDNPKEIQGIPEPKERHVRAYKYIVIEEPQRNGAYRQLTRQHGQEVFPTDIITEGALVNQSDVKAVFSFADGSEFILPPGEGIVVTTAGGVVPFSECVASAKETCGVGCVGSVTWTAPGNCSSACKTTPACESTEAQ